MDDWYILTNARNATATTTQQQKNRLTLRAEVFWLKFGSNLLQGPRTSQIAVNVKTNLKCHFPKTSFSFVTYDHRPSEVFFLTK